ncbi:MAG: hypothetical protein JXN59_15195, partial [Anaerolineae bacterium]|nr:hypothetical protein [Anaerolineae bacterium]
LRIGDIAGYLTVQRSESDAWMLGQTDLFWQYQELKRQYDVDLTGTVLDLAIDENRARVLVEEFIGGQRYQQLWFYWRYADGWRHVPLDVDFWGEPEVASGNGYTIEYGAVDAPLVAALQPGVDRLWGQGCDWLGCATPLPALTIRVLPDPAVEVSWSPDEPDVLRVASPLVDRMLAETPLLPAAERQIGALLAERVRLHATPGGPPVPGTDAAFIYGALDDWLIGRFLADGGVPGSTFIASLVEAYGERAPGLLAAGVGPDAAISSLALIFATPLEDLRADWREFFQWRLALEPYWLAQGNAPAVLALYDDLAQNEAQRLISTPGAASVPALTVLRVVTGPGSDGAPRAWAVVQYPDGSEGPITFRLVDGIWRRSIPDAAFPGGG